MKPSPRWQPPYPQSWAQVYRDIAALLLGFLAAVHLIHWLKRALGI